MLEEELLENPGASHWDTMGDHRAYIDRRAEMDAKLEFMPVKVSRKKDKRGLVSTTIEGGPHIRVRDTRGGDYRYTLTNKKTGATKTYPYRRAKLFTFTSKMSCASFSIPAGPGRNRGTCPASVQAAVEREGSYTKFHPPIDSMEKDQQYICDVCYAGKNNYLRFNAVAMSQVCRWKWVLKTLREGTFADRMIEAIDSLFHPDSEEVFLSHGLSNQFFRIHDSGDFMTKDYYRAWVKVCAAFSGKYGKGPRKLIYFWAPTRQWVFSDWRREFDENPAAINLALRPSALFTGAPAPEIPGMANGSTSVPGSMGAPVWNCPAYEGADEASCAGTRCRRCWTRKKQAVNYRTH